MHSLKRFFQDHLRTHLPLVLGAALLLTLAGLCQGLMVTSIKFVFEDNLGMAAPKGVDNLALAAQAKGWLVAHLPASSLFRESTYLVPALIVTIFLVKGLFTYSGTLIMVRSGIRATQALRERLFSHFLRQEPAFFQQHPVGELLQRCITDVGAVQGIASNQLAEAVREITIAIAMLATVLWMDWRLSLSLFIAFPLVVVPIRKLSRRIRNVNHRNMEATAGLLQRLKEVFANVRVVLGFAREDFEVERFHRQQHELFRLGMKSARASAMSHPIMEVVGGLLLAGLIIYASKAIQRGALTGPNFFTYLMAVYAFYDPIRRLTKLNNDVQQARASLDRVYEMLDRESTLAVPAHPAPVPLEPQVLRFEAVAFHYDPKHPVLRGIDLEVRRGETVALVGGSGGGKTTLVNLVPRFFDPTAGRVLLDGTDLRAFDPRELRRRIGVVTQETLLFMDSVHDNIAYGQPASREAVVDAARKAHAHDFISALPRGYDTPLAETGSSLSGGQRQRLAIARALLQDPPILILDEATSALDSESERAVQDALEILMQDRTTLVIAHRLSTVQRATRICVLKHGRVEEVGGHEQLLALGGEYARLHALQFAEGLMHRSEFAFELPDDLIAQHPEPQRDASRLLVVDPVAGTLQHRSVRDLPELLAPGTLCVPNDVKVRHARLHLRRSGGGAGEALLLRSLPGGAFEALVRPGARLRDGTTATVVHPESAQALAELRIEATLPEGLRVVRLHAGGQDLDWDGIDRIGRLPLPPYIKHLDSAEDEARYQTVFHGASGEAVAAPTAGLHFTPELIAALGRRSCGWHPLRLHVGLGTFRPITADDLDDHVMHEERYEVPASAAAALEPALRSGTPPVLAVGTTALRSLEAAWDGRALAPSGATRLFIRPGYRIHTARQLFTNFHLPESTLFVLVSTLLGLDVAKACYAEAIKERYRFFSYGDAMLILRFV